MKKEYAIFVGAALLMVLVIGGGYQLYLKPTAERLDEKQQEYRSYDSKLRELDGRYGGYVPQDVVSAWNLQMQPWHATMEARGDLFGLGRLEIEEVPLDTLPKFHYAEQYTAMIEELRAEAFEKGITLPPLNLDVPSAQIEDARMTREEVEEYLLRIATASSMVRMLLDRDPVAIHAVHVWPPRQVTGRITAYSVGYSFTMRMRALAEFMDDICSRPRYASIDSFSIVNDNLLAGADPPLMVQMVVTQAQYEHVEQQDPETIMAQATERGSEQALILQSLRDRPLSDREDMRRQPPTRWQQFRRKYLPF